MKVDKRTSQIILITALRPNQRVMPSWSPSVRVAALMLLVFAMSICGVICGNEDEALDPTRTSSRQLLSTKAHRHKLHRIHGWCLCLAWGWFIPAGIVIASCRSLTRLGSNWWYYLHIAFQIIGLLLSLTGVAVGTYFPANEELMVQHKQIGIVVNVVAGLQVLLGFIARPPKTSMVRRAWNLTHWTVGRAILALAIANIFIGFYLSNVAHKHIIAQAVVLGGLFIIYMLKNDIEYLLVRISPAEEDRLLVIAQQPGSKQFNVEMGDVRGQANGHTNGHANGHKASSIGVHIIV